MTATAVINIAFLLPAFGLLLMIVLQELIFSRRPQLAAIQQGKVQTELVHRMDFIGAILIVGLFGVLLALNQIPPEVGADGKPKEVKLTPFVLIFGMIAQSVPAVIVIVFVLARGANPMQFFSLAPKWKDLRLIFLVVPMALVMTYVFLYMTELTGYNAWLKSVFGEDAKMQEIVRIYQETDAVLIRVLLAIMAIIVAPLVEEVVFRGYIYPVAKKCGGASIAIILTSLLFASVHGNINAMAPLFFLAILLALAYEFTNTLWAPILIHVAFNSVTIVFQELARNSPAVSP